MRASWLLVMSEVESIHGNGGRALSRFNAAWSAWKSASVRSTLESPPARRTWMR